MSSACSPDAAVTADTGPQPCSQGVSLDPSTGSVTLSGVALTLTGREFRLLSVLIEKSGRVVTSRMLLDRVWGPEFPGDPSTLAVHIMRLRDKLATAGIPRQSIATIRGLGYRLDDLQLADPGR